MDGFPVPWHGKWEAPPSVSRLTSEWLRRDRSGVKLRISCLPVLCDAFCFLGSFGCCFTKNRRSQSWTHSHHASARQASPHSVPCSTPFQSHLSAGLSLAPFPCQLSGDTPYSAPSHCSNLQPRGPGSLCESLPSATCLSKGWPLHWLCTHRQTCHPVFAHGTLALT